MYKWTASEKARRAGKRVDVRVEGGNILGLGQGGHPSATGLGVRIGVGQYNRARARGVIHLRQAWV